ncbi:MAG: hypothetical protein IPM31_05275 [Anaerolineae bacterium]|nr:hypothetical protein [Anaerolineae bacterium]MBL8106316.1 hypothetical protein [Anaerolineales bacterium]MCC7187763.1 hypothetical protein [Anaerolineales bacterium]
MKTPVFVLLIAIVLFVVFAMISSAGSSGIMGAAAVASLFCGLFALVLPKVIERVNPKVWIFTGLVLLALLLIPTSLLFSDLATAAFFLIPLALINAAFLLYSGLSLRSSEPQARIVIPVFFVGILLIIGTLFKIYDLTVWDNTYDSLKYILLFAPMLAVLLSGLTLLIALPSKTKLAGIAYLLLAPALMIWVSTLAQRVDFRALTSQRADRVVQAIESFYAREERYPASLSELTPRYILALPEPVIIYGQTWCYESGDGYYRLGYVDREHWSDPRMIGRIFKAEGQPAQQSLMCEAEIATLQQADPFISYWMESQ